MNLRQEINLYQTAGAPTRSLLAAADVLIATTCIVVALLAFWSYGYIQVSKLSRELTAVRDRQAQQQTQIQETLQATATPEELAVVQARVTGLKAQVATRTAALKALGNSAEEASKGFAPRLEALARRHIGGLWLDSMLLTSEHNGMSLGGVTQEPQLISQYLRSLSQDPVLSGIRFDQFVVERASTGESDAPTAVMHFHASSPGLAFKTEDKS